MMAASVKFPSKGVYVKGAIIPEDEDEDEDENEGKDEEDVEEKLDYLHDKLGETRGVLNHVAATGDQTSALANSLRAALLDLGRHLVGRGSEVQDRE